MNGRPRPSPTSSTMQGPCESTGQDACVPKRPCGFRSRSRNPAGELPQADAVGSVYRTTKGNFFSLLDPAVVFSGSLPGEAIVGELLVLPAPGSAALRPEDIRINPMFVDFLHQVIAHLQHHRCQTSKPRRVRQHDGWIYIIDARTPAPQGDVPPEDVMGGFEVRGGRLVPDSYTGNPSHQIISERGLFRLPDALQDCLIGELERRTAE